MKNVDEKEKTFYYRIFEGNKINIMDWSDYIGIVVTSPDFPVKQQYYLRFNYSNDEQVSENRRRYKIYQADEKYPPPYFEDQNINVQVKQTREERIIFLKYFGKDDDLNYINYENNNINSSQMMDIIKSNAFEKVHHATLFNR